MAPLDAEKGADEFEPRTVRDLFIGFEPKGNKDLAIAKIGEAWDRMTPEQRLGFFSGIGLGPQHVSGSWRALGMTIKQPIYEAVFRQVFGDHKTPFVRK